MADHQWFVYIITNKPFGTLYIGVTGDLSKRIFAHKQGAGAKFAARYKLDRLVYYDTFDNPSAAIQREKTLKKWPRNWKLNAIGRMNPEWADLYEILNQ
ncbi:MAG: GIY-YIG nuclease family protein [Pseudomonadota bacterium]